MDVTDEDSVFAAVDGFRADFGTLDRVVINAGIGKGAPLGTGRQQANRETAMTNFVGALTQAEAAMAVFRAQGAGHLVMISSMSAMRGLPRSMTTYAATKAGVAHLAEGLRNELHGTPIKVSVIYPGWIESEMNAGSPGADDGLHREGRRRHRARHREGEVLGLRPAPALGPHVRGDAARPAPPLPAAALTR